MAAANYHNPSDVFHVVSCERVFHVVVLENGDGQFIAWCLEFPTITLHADSIDQALSQISDRIDCTYRQMGDPPGA
jgi:hypothetical protein